MIKLSEYAKLLKENKITPESFDRKIQAAVKSIFDIDDVVIVKNSVKLTPPSFAHSYFSSSVVFTYKIKKFRIMVRFYHLKYPDDELIKMTRQEWDDMLKSAEQIPNIDTSDEMLKKESPYFKFTANLAFYPYEETNKDLSFEESQENYIGSIKSNNLGDLIVKSKKMIDDLGSGNDDSRDEPEPIFPTTPVKKSMAIAESDESRLVYHLTKTSNIPSIKQYGLKPSTPVDMPTEDEGVYVFKTKEDAEDALMSWYGERYDDEEEEFSLLTIDTSGLRLFSTLVDYEYVSYETIPSANIIKIEDI